MQQGSDPLYMNTLPQFAARLFNRLPLPYRLKIGIKSVLKRALGRASVRQGRSALPGMSTQLHQRSACAMTGQQDVLIFSIIDWHFRIQRPQQIARHLALAGKHVFYVSNHFIDRDEPGYEIEPIEGERLCQVRFYVKGAPAIYFAGPDDASVTQLKAGFRLLAEQMNIFSATAIVQHAYWLPLVKALPNTLRVYDCMDHHEGFGNVARQLITMEHELMKTADLVVVTSEWLKTSAQAHNPALCVVRNAGEFKHFAVRPEQVYTDAGGRKIVGYFGAIAEWFDVALIEKIAMAHPGALVLLVGNDTVGAGKRLARLPNVVLTGEVPYKMLPYYLHAFDVCLLPFLVLPLTLATNPVKVYEYLASGRPVVCTDLPEVAQFGDLVTRAVDHTEFVAQVGQALARPPTVGMVEARKRFASQQTWEARVTALNDRLKAVHLPKISVVVLTYNNLDLTRLCIESVLERTDYSQLELIVVDNRSTDDTPEYLKALRSKHPEVKIILNKSNLGFAAGNNMGLQVATGDYLVMLNNDTVVTHGWLLTMLRHFQDNPRLGLLGPVTNNIGNEARVEVGYPDLEAMPVAARTHTLRHMGERLRMRNAAFFCVMMPRRVFTEVGYLDENFGRGFFEDDDYCRRVELLGLEVACAEDVFVHHHLSASFNQLATDHKQQLFDTNKAYYESKWGTWVPHEYRSRA